MKKIIILDRDGVINYDSYNYIKTPEEFLPIPGSLEAIATLNRAGYEVIIATNQSGIARGYYDVAMLDQIHEKLRRELAAVDGYISDILFCPHHPDENCTCRKPLPGMLLQISKKHQVNLSDTFFVGDKLSDVQAARAVGCKPLLVRTALEPPAESAEIADVPRFADLAQAVSYLVRLK